MKTVISITRVAFTFIGTVVGAGFASGQEILQFFTKYGSIALYTIAISSLLFIWLGTKLLLLAHELKVTTYAELNIVIFGHRVGSIISLCTLIILLGSVSVMLAGSGTLLHEQLHISYLAGLAITLLLAYVVLVRGIQAIMNINTVVVPLMLLCCLILVFMTWQSPVPYHEMVSHQVHSIKMVVAAPFLYTAFNLAMAQAVIVPLGATIRDRSILLYGGIFGGVGIGLLLYASHYVLSTKMPLIMFEQMPLASLMKTLGTVSQYGYACIYLVKCLRL